MAQTQSQFDSVIIGGGHNGLIAAAYLARQGKKVCVVEGRDVLGGCSVTEELWPGYKVSSAAYVLSLLLPEIMQDLRLRDNGLVILPRTPSSFTPLLDGRHLMLGPDKTENQQQISKFSQRDAENYPRYESLLESVATHLEPILSESSPDLLPLPKKWRQVKALKRFADLKKAWRLNKALSQMGDHIPEGLELLTAAARPILERWFESEALKATLATDAIIGAFSSISSPGTAYVLLHHVMGTAGGARGVWGYVQGGMGELATVLRDVCEQLGVEIRTNSLVKSIIVNKNKAAGVVLEDGTQIDAKTVASSVDANLTFNRLLSDGDLPQHFRDAVNRIDYSSASLKINLALSEPPCFDCLPDKGLGPQHNGTIHITETLDEIEDAYFDALKGKPSQRPVLECTIPTSVDKTISPQGKHIMSMFVQYAPYKLAGGKSWDEIGESFADRCVERLAQYAPNVLGSIEHRHIYTPLDLERTFGLTGGNIFQGAMNLSQLHMLRPVAGWSDHRTPIEGLYLCGAASHPGGGVMGACGRNAAIEMLRDRIV